MQANELALMVNPVDDRAMKTKRPSIQHLTLRLDGITAGDYLQWVRDPEPPTLGQALRSIEIGGDSLGTTIDAVLSWEVPPPHTLDAAPAAGLPLIPEVVGVEAPLVWG